MPELLGLPYSPWSERARWALEARGVAYRSRTYQPLLGELELRRKLGRWRGIVSVPVLTADDGEVLSDSVEIARWADRRGEGPTLFPAGEDAAIARFVALSDRGLGAGRALSLHRLLEDRAGLVEMVPRRLRALPGSVPLARLGIERTLRKYGAADRRSSFEEAAAVLDELRTALVAGGGRTLLGAFSFADVTMAQVLAFVSPPAFGLRLGKATRASFVDPELASRFADLVAWRDRLYDEHRPRPSVSGGRGEPG